SCKSCEIFCFDMTKRIVLASSNPGQVREINQMLAGLHLTVVPQSDFEVTEVEETGLTFVENAILKARNAARFTQFAAIADDSGLEVDALNGAPGLYSARYASLGLPPSRLGGMGGEKEGGDAERRALLLQNLRDKPRPWKAHFHATIAIAKPTGEVELAEGNCFGEIIPAERGSGGFGYDPIFFIPELKKTMAELDMVEKNRLSHRARAVMQAMPVLKKMFGL
ncbi:MAG: RdgB/HAM1 family non-canonical purine NTP pyrophosphatase, partial [Anaerolineales bacterium]|nr:RdgB/HAM1 family non-canonical purine NTP pyrophosphatase [Anaerolineales bacterium]